MFCKSSLRRVSWFSSSMPHNKTHHTNSTASDSSKHLSFFMLVQISLKYFMGYALLLPIDYFDSGHLVNLYNTVYSASLLGLIPRLDWWELKGLLNFLKQNCCNHKHNKICNSKAASDFLKKSLISTFIPLIFGS